MNKEKSGTFSEIKVLLIYAGVIFLIVKCCSYQCHADDRERAKYEKEKNKLHELYIKSIETGDFSKARSAVSELNISYHLYDHEKEEMLSSITRAQIAFLINTGSIEQAYSIAQEENVIAVFYDSFLPKLTEVYEDQGKVKILQFLAKVEFPVAPDLTDLYVTEHNASGKYNSYASKFNSLLEQFILYVDIKGDNEFATQLLKFIKPIVTELKDEKGRSNGAVLTNQPREEIKKKLEL
ncbi:MAG: hypothetical protein SNI51_04950 [Rikenellaceae bacterium]